MDRDDRNWYAMDSDRLETPDCQKKRHRGIATNKTVHRSIRSAVFDFRYLAGGCSVTVVVPLVTATIVSRKKTHKHLRRCSSVDCDAGGRLETAIHFERAIGKSSATKNTNTFVDVTWSIETQTVDWRHRITSSERWASRGLHYHASKQNWPMIAGCRSNSYNNAVGIRNSDI